MWVEPIWSSEMYKKETHSCLQFCFLNFFFFCPHPDLPKPHPVCICVVAMKNRYFLPVNHIPHPEPVCLSGCVRPAYWKNGPDWKRAKCEGGRSCHSWAGLLTLLRLKVWPMAIAGCGHGATSVSSGGKATEGRRIHVFLLSGAPKCRSQKPGTEVVWFGGLPSSLGSLPCCVMHSRSPVQLTWKWAVPGHFLLSRSQKRPQVAGFLLSSIMLLGERMIAPSS